MQDVFQAGEVGESINRMIVKIDNVLKFSNIEQSNVSAQEDWGQVPLVNLSKCNPYQLKKNCQNYL